MHLDWYIDNGTGYENEVLQNMMIMLLMMMMMMVMMGSGSRPVWIY
jgi:hypothetical protein